ncbi:MAG: GNAT family N-acetyltransferase, partial [Bifidobacteriaceae bacterium]|nr:GNAT family N-acetyltransferase [Bifidobacteriaceae bacterium]
FEALNDFGKANNIDLKSNDESTKQPTIKKYNPYISADETPTEDLQIVQEDDADTENLHLNNFSEDNLNNKILDIKNFYISTRLSNSRETLAQQCKPYQDEIQKGTLKYNNAIKQLYILNPTWKQISSIQKGTISELEQLQKINETSKHRVVGLVIETRPDTINSESLTLIRQLGCTKIQIGVQSLYQEILDKNHRYITIKKIEETFSLLRIFGFKIHAHFMVNLLGSNPEMDKLDYANFVQNPAFMPDEVKIYPCSLVDGTPLMDHYNSGEWQAYNEDDLVDVLVHDTEVTPRFCRISRMIRDISAHDIVAGNKKGNLRQIVENKITQKHDQINEIRYREINDEDFAREDLRLNEFEYDTYAAKEIFLEWITPDDKIAGFLRLSLPKKEIIQTLNSENNFPIKFDEAMIREIHVYGKVAKIHKSGVNSQHLGLGKNLVKRAKEIARTTGYKKLNVISSVGTREYYRKLGFVDGDLYQQALL